MLELCAKLGSALVLVLSLPTISWAAGIGCYDAKFFPRDGSVVPENLPGVLFWPTDVRWDDADAGVDDVADQVVLVETGEDGHDTPVAFTLEGDSAPYLIVPDDGFQAGATYRLWAQRCGELSPSDSYPPAFEERIAGDETPIPYATLAVVAAAELPAELPPLAAGDPVAERVAYLGDCSGCGGPYEAVNVYVELAEDAGPWQDALAFETRVDGQRYAPSPYYKFATLHGKSWVGHGRDRLTALCEETDWVAPRPLGEGLHRVTLQATIPGLDLVLTSNEVEVTLDCEQAGASTGTGDGERDGETDTDDDGDDADTDGGRRDIDGPVPMESAVNDEADADGRDEAPAHERAAPSEKDGCTVSSVQGGQRGTGLPLALLATGLLRLRRRGARPRR